MTDFITAGSLEVSGTLTGTFSADGLDHLSRLLGLTDPPRHDISVECPTDADRRCPVCREPATALILEDVAVVGGGNATVMDAKRGDGRVSYWVVGLDPAAYRAEPCGHRFGRDGKEIDSD